MKIQHSITGLSIISFTSISQINPVTGQPTGVVLDQWEDIPHSTAKALEELQNRILKLEMIVSRFGTENQLIEVLDAIERFSQKHEKTVQEEPPPGIPLSRIPKPKRGPKPKAPV